jgi:hypothetical protein
VTTREKFKLIINDTSANKEDFSFKKFKICLYHKPSEIMQYDSGLELTYQFWRKLWKETFYQLAGSEKLHSDNFTRQTAIVTLSHENEIVGSFSLRETTFSYSSSYDDSIFDSWNLEALNSFRNSYATVVVCSGLGIRPDFRSLNIEGISIKNVLCQLAASYLLDSQHEALIATTRVDKRVGLATKKVGAKICAHSKMHGVDVELICIEKSEIQKNSSNYINPNVQNIWETKDIVSKEMVNIKKSQKFKMSS